MRFVDDQRVVASEHTVALNFGEENAVGHELDVGAVRDLVGEPHGVSDGVAEFGVEFFGDTFGNGACCQPARLCVSDQTADATSEFETDLRDLGCLTRAGLAGDDDNLILRDRGRDVVLALTDGQSFRIRDCGNIGGACGQPRARRFDFLGQRHQSVWCAGHGRVCDGVDSRRGVRPAPARSSGHSAWGESGAGGVVDMLMTAYRTRSQLPLADRADVQISTSDDKYRK